jgi:predicted RNA-binding Zn ribbon-like protein
VFTFVGGNLALDLVGTVAERGTTDLEQLDSPEAAARWFVDAGVLDEPPRVDQRGLRRVRELREALYRLLRSDPGALPAAELRVVNGAAAGEPPTPVVDASGGVHRTGGLSAGLAAVARSYADLLDASDAVLRWCEAAECTRPFLDRSRGHRRRWCGMANCGDRMKARAYRTRRRVSGSATKASERA